jgi:NADPH2:quinone reductase
LQRLADMSHAIRIHAFGGPEVLSWEPQEPGEPGRGQALIRQTAVGLNLIDVYERTGLYPNPLPTGLGREGAGVVEALGPGVRGLAVGDRVAYFSNEPGAYAQWRCLAADRLVTLPDGVSDRLAAAAILKGLTAHFLLRRTHRVKAGDKVVIHAAAGGVGLIATQWASHLGATVIGVVGSEAKAEVARSHGCHHVVRLGYDDLPTQVRKFTGGRGADVVYDSTGRETFFASLDCLRPLGLMVSFGNASGPVPAFQPLELARRGSLFLTRPTLFHYIARRPELVRAARELFDVVGRGVVRIEIGQTYALQDVAQAHRDLESRRTIGSTVLIP